MIFLSEYLNLMLTKYKMYRYFYTNTSSYIFKQYINNDNAVYVIRIFGKNGYYKVQIVMMNLSLLKQLKI